MSELKWIATARKLIGLAEDPRKGYTINKIPEMWDFVNTKIDKKGIIKNGSCHSDLFEGRLVKVSV